MIDSIMGFWVYLIEKIQELVGIHYHTLQKINCNKRKNYTN